MNKTISFIISLVILLIIYSIVDSIINKSKCSAYVKSTMFLLMIIIVFSFAANPKSEMDLSFNLNNYQIDKESVWKSTLDNIEKETENLFINLFAENGLIIEKCSVNLETDFSEIKISSVKLMGKDKAAAKNLIVGHFNLNPAYIDISGD